MTRALNWIFAGGTLAACVFYMPPVTLAGVIVLLVVAFLVIPR